MNKKISLLILVFLCFSFFSLSAQNADLVTEIIETEQVTFGQAAYLFAVYLDLISDESTEIDAVNALVDAGIMKQQKSLDGSISHAAFAGLCMKAWDIPGGLMYSITHSNRYAFRELQVLGLISNSVDPMAPISG